MCVNCGRAAHMFHENGNMFSLEVMKGFRTDRDRYDAVRHDEYNWWPKCKGVRPRTGNKKKKFPAISAPKRRSAPSASERWMGRQEDNPSTCVDLLLSVHFTIVVLFGKKWKIINK